MPRIVLDAQQTQVVANADGVIEVCDSDGNVLGVLTLIDEITKARQRITSANEDDWLSTEKVLEKLKTES
jgi:hypothetical protein